ncbi:MAG: aminoacyl-histidine dipeptidase, partial [Deltaproteobacteria bacterium]
MSKPVNYPENPKELWNIFYDFTRIPRPSGHEQKVIDYIKDLAEKNGATWKQDAKGNLVVYVPASEDRKEAAPLLVQNHVDM